MGNLAFKAHTSFSSHQSDYKDYKHHENLIVLNKSINKPSTRLSKAFVIDTICYIKKNLK